MQNVDNALQPFFAEWTTSLMGSDIVKLKSISADSRIRQLISTIIIEDECRLVDPFAAPELPSLESTYRIWPRNSAGVVKSSEMGVADLSTILREGLLRPREIKVRDYQIESGSFLIGPEMGRIGSLIGEVSQSTAEPVPLAAFARDVIEGANLYIKSISFGTVDHDYGQNSVLNSSEFLEKHPNIRSVGGPNITEAVIELSPADQDGGSRFSMLEYADLRLGHEGESYWLRKVFYEAKKLKTAKLSTRSTQDQQLEAERVVPTLTSLSLHGGRLSAGDIRTMLASSKESLSNIDLRGVVLNEGSTWREVLSFVAKEYQALKSFSLSILREGYGGGPAVDWRELVHDNVSERFRANLNLIEKGPPDNKRVTRLSYSGFDAGKMLEIIAAHGYVPESYEAGRRSV